MLNISVAFQSGQIEWFSRRKCWTEVGSLILQAVGSVFKLRMGKCVVISGHGGQLRSLPELAEGSPMPLEVRATGDPSLRLKNGFARDDASRLCAGKIKPTRLREWG